MSTLAVILIAIGGVLAVPFVVVAALLIAAIPLAIIEKLEGE